MIPATANTPSVRGAAVRLADILQRAGLIDANGVRAALARLSAQGGWLGQHVVALGLSDGAHIADALAQATRTPRVVFARVVPQPEAIQKLDRDFCQEHRCLPLALREAGKTLVLAMVDPTDIVALQKAVLRSGCSVRPVVATEAEIAGALEAATSEEPVFTSLAGSMVESTPANDPVGLTPARIRAAPGSGSVLETVAPVDLLAQLQQRLAATELELRRTQQMVRALVGVALEKGLATRGELAALAARPPSR